MSAQMSCANLLVTLVFARTTTRANQLANAHRPPSLNTASSGRCWRKRPELVPQASKRSCVGARSASSFFRSAEDFDLPRLTSGGHVPILMCVQAAQRDPVSSTARDSFDITITRKGGPRSSSAEGRIIVWVQRSARPSSARRCTCSRLGWGRRHRRPCHLATTYRYLRSERASVALR